MLILTATSYFLTGLFPSHFEKRQKSCDNLVFMHLKFKKNNSIYIHVYINWTLPITYEVK